MEFVDVNGVNLRPGQRVAWATVGRGGVLATGTVHPKGTIDRSNDYGPGWAQHAGVFVTLDSNGRTIEIPYRADKFVVMGQPVELALCPACAGVYNSEGE